MKFKESIIEESYKGNFIFEIEGSDWTKYLEKAKKDLYSELKVEGFRKGQVPESICAKHVSERKILQHAANLFAKKCHHFALNNKDSKIVPFDLQNNFHIDVLEASEKLCKVKIEFELQPSVKIGNWRDIKVSFKKKEVSEDDVLKNIDAILDSKSFLEVVSDTSVEKGSIANIDFVGTIDNKKFAGGTGKNYDLEIGSNVFVKNFEEQLIGLKENEEKEIKITFPSDYKPQTLADKKAVFKVKINSVKIKKKPELNDDFVKSLNIENVLTVADFKEHTKKELEKKFEQNSLENLQDEIVEKLLNISQVRLPYSVVEKEYKKMLNEFNQSLKQHNLTIDKYFDLVNQDKNAFEKQMWTDANNKLSLGFIFDSISKSENIITTDDEVEKFLEEVARVNNLKIEELKKKIPSYDELKFRLSNDKIWKLIQKEVIKFDNNETK
ncbi:trigger factor [symbiont of Argiope bruennichi]|uniref:trigger factor n=1 Tax=symbiont of Argiope bruennichi TaxID=2810479 RepID=UPI003DA38BCB